MSTYAISDLHGYPLEKLKALLDRVGFSNEDTLYVIGDVIDRNGDSGAIFCGGTISKCFTGNDGAKSPHHLLYYSIG